MPGRKKIEYKEIDCDVVVQTQDGTEHVWRGVKMTCPKCGSRNVRSYGSKNYKETRVRGLVCRNPDCPREGRKGPQQFLPHTSGVVKDMVHELLGKMVREIYVHGAKAKTVASSHGVSESFVSFIRDEVDAAMDEANTQRLAGLLREFAERSQFIVITHKKRTMAAADVLYGVTMQESGVSKLVAVRSEDWPDADEPPASRAA